MEAAGFVDAEVVQAADGRRSRADFQHLVAGKVVAADPETAARREAEARDRRFARASRSSEHGMKMFCIRAGTALITRFDATVAYLADALQALGDPDNEDERRLKACLIMANPTQAVELLHAYADHRAQKHGTHSGSGAGAGRGDDGDAGGGQDQPLPLHDDEPVGEGDVHPSQNDADDPDDPESEPAPGRCPSCGGPGWPVTRRRSSSRGRSGPATSAPTAGPAGGATTRPGRYPRSPATCTSPRTRSSGTGTGSPAGRTRARSPTSSSGRTSPPTNGS